MTELGHALTHQGETTDIRAQALDNMTAEIARLTTKNDQIMAAAYQTSATTEQVHRAVLKLTEAQKRTDFITIAETQIAPILRIPHAKIEERYVRVLGMMGRTAELPLDDAHVLVMTGSDSESYAQSQGTDLLRFFHQITQHLWQALEG